MYIYINTYMHTYINEILLVVFVNLIRQQGYIHTHIHTWIETIYIEDI